MVYSDYKFRNLITILFVLLGFVLVLLQTHTYNLGVTSDGVNYIEVARNIMKGHGIVNDVGDFINHWPPLYALVLAGFSKLLNLDPFLSGKYLNAILLGVTFLVFNLILNLQRTTDKIRILLNILLLFSISLNIYTWFLSEPLFITILLIALYFFRKWTILKKPYLLILSGLSFSFLILTRYAGIGFVGGLLIYLLISNKETILSRIKNCFILMASIAPITSIWFLYSNERAGDLANRSFSFHPIALENILSFGKTILSWILPFQSNLQLAIIGVILFGIFIYVIFKTPNLNTNLRTVARLNKNHLYIFGLTIVCYLLFIVLSISFIDAAIPMDSRIMAPIFPLLLFLISPFLAFYISKPFKITVLNFLFIIIFILSVNTAIVSWFTAIDEGQGITSKKFKDSETLQRLPQFLDKEIYTNDVNYISLYFPETSQQLKPLPKWLLPGNMTEDVNKEAEILKMKEAIENNEAVLIYFNTVNWKFYQINSEDIRKIFTDRPIIEIDDGFIIE